MSPAALFFSCVAIWGTTWIAVTFQVAATAPEFGVALRFTLAALVLLAWCAWRGIDLALDRATHLRLALLGALGFCLSYLFVYHALHYIVSGLVAVGYSAIPLVNMVLARMFFGTPMSRRVGLGGTLGLAGIALIFWPEFGRLAADRPLVLGALLTAAGVLASALANMLMTSVQRRGVSGWGPLALGMTYGAAASWLVVLAAGVPTAIRWSWGFGLSLAYLVLAGSVLAFGAYYALLARVGAARAGYVGVMSTVVALLVSALFEGYDWRTATVIGIALAVAGNVLALQPARRPAAAPTPKPAPKPAATADRPVA
jgi:drug/metabolite transporter (DMT)-like permease